MADVILIDLPGLEGTSQLEGYAKKIEILSYSHGVAMQVTGDVSNTERTSGRRRRRQADRELLAQLRLHQVGLLHPEGGRWQGRHRAGQVGPQPQQGRVRSDRGEEPER